MQLQKNITKIANISPDQLSEGLKNKLVTEGFARFSDNKEVFDIYCAWSILNDYQLIDNSCFTGSELDELNEIDDLLVEAQCDYFRIIE